MQGLSAVGFEIGQQTLELGIVAQQFSPGLDQEIHLLLAEVETGGSLIEKFTPSRILDVVEIDLDEIGRDRPFRGRHPHCPAVHNALHQLDGRHVVAVGLQIAHGADGLFQCRLPLERVIEHANQDTWRKIRDDLKQIQLAQLLSPNGTVWQMTKPRPETSIRLKNMKIKTPKPMLYLL